MPCQSWLDLQILLQDSLSDEGLVFSSSLLDYCKSNFDYVIIDGPAMLVSDAKILAAQAEATIIVFNAANTHRGAAMRLLREMREIHADVIGSVLMGVKSRKGGYFQEFYRSYQDYQRVHVEQPV